MDRSTAHEERLFHRLQLAAHELRKYADDAVRSTGLSTAQLAMIAVVAEGPVAQRVVADRLGFNESAVTAMVHRLERDGLVERRPDPADGRVRLLHLTDHGAEVGRQGAERFGVVNDALDAALGADGVAALAAALDRVRVAASRAATTTDAGVGAEGPASVDTVMRPSVDPAAGSGAPPRR